MRSGIPLALLVVSLLGSSAGCTGAPPSSPPLPIRIGSGEAVIERVVAELYADALVAEGLAVDRSAIGTESEASLVEAVATGRLDIVPAAVGSSVALIHPGMETPDGGANRMALAALVEKRGVSVLDATPGSDSPGFYIRYDLARRMNLESLADLGPSAGSLRFGVPAGCTASQFCGLALGATYGLDLAHVTLLPACSVAMATALDTGRVDVAQLCRVQPEVLLHGFVRLADPRATQLVDRIAPLVRTSLLRASATARIGGVLNRVSGRLDDGTLRDLAIRLLRPGTPIRTVAAQWLLTNGIVAN